MLKRERFEIARIYVPVKRRHGLNPDVVREIAESILEIGQQTPILVRPDGDRFVLVEGLHRLEACRALGEETILGSLVQARAQSAASSAETEGDAVRLKIERLRQLRLSKEGAEKSPAESPAESASAKDKHADGPRRSSHSKAATLLDWLAEREDDGFRR